MPRKKMSLFLQAITKIAATFMALIVALGIIGIRLDLLIISLNSINKGIINGTIHVFLLQFISHILANICVFGYVFLNVDSCLDKESKDQDTMLKYVVLNLIYIVGYFSYINTCVYGNSGIWHVLVGVNWIFDFIFITLTAIVVIMLLCTNLGIMPMLEEL